MTDHLADTADATAWRLAEPAVLDTLREDAAAGGILTATLRAFADADLSATGAAAALGVHANTVHHRLDRLRARTGRNPRRFHDLAELLTAARMLAGG
ncbi:MAG: helix-turn-helix domain-containing protein [Thermoleophilia bacterium]